MTMQTFTPIQYLMIDIASNYGLDKESWDARLQWFSDYLEAHLRSADDLKTNQIFQAFVKQADSPALFQAGCLAYRQALRGESITYPISLDATASGAQILSILIGCRKSASLCNVIDTGRREDLYTNVNELMNARLDADHSVARSDSKQAVMTSLYGSTAQPLRVFGDGERLDCFYTVMNEELPGIWELNQDLLGLADPTVDEYSWTMPDNFHVKTKVTTTVYHDVMFDGEEYRVPEKVQGPKENDKSIGANTVHSIDGMVVREMLRRCYYDYNVVTDIKVMLQSGLHEMKSTLERPMDKLMQTLWDHYQLTGFLSARILENLDEENLWWVDKDVILKLIESLPRKPFPVLAVHDCFRVHPNYGNDLRRQYNNILSDLADSTILESIVSQIAGQKITAQRRGELSADVKEANYALS